MEYLKQNNLDDLHYMYLTVSSALEYSIQKFPKDKNKRFGAQVGSLVVRDGEIVSIAVNDSVAGERFHAEEIVLQKLHAEGDLSDCSMYITMEPCNGNPYHTRKHYCEQIINRNLGKVIIAQKKHLYEGGFDAIDKAGLSIGRLEHDILSRVSSVLSNQTVSLEKLKKCKEDLLELSPLFPPLIKEEREKIASCLGIDF